MGGSPIEHNNHSELHTLLITPNSAAALYLMLTCFAGLHNHKFSHTKIYVSEIWLVVQDHKQLSQEMGWSVPDSSPPQAGGVREVTNVLDKHGMV